MPKQTTTIELADGAPAPGVADVVDDMRLEAIIEACDLARSYALSAAEAGWRGERATLGIHLAQLRLATIEAIRLFKSLEAPAGEKARMDSGSENMRREATRAITEVTE